jgi:hypothetical protein
MTLDTSTMREAIEAFRDSMTGTFQGYHREEVEALVKKWTWYLQDSLVLRNGQTIEMKPIKPEAWPLMALLLENQTRANPYIKSEWESSSRADISLPATYTLPLIRAIFPNLIMNEICLVRPMPPSSGGTMQLFWKNVYREDTVTTENVTTANSLYGIHATDASVPKRLKMTITSETVTATQEMLMASWPTRMEEDIRGVMGLDVDQELINDMMAEIMRELEHRVVATILAGATAGNVDWDATPADTYTGSVTDFYQGIYHAFLDAEKLVVATQYRQCDYIVAGMDVLGAMEKANWFGGPMVTNTAGPYRTAVEYIGTKGRWQVYWSPYIESTEAFISFKPEGMLRGGYIWAPYVPFMAMPRVYAEALGPEDETLPGALVANDNWTRRVRSRNAQYYCQPKMFATVTLKETA